MANDLTFQQLSDALPAGALSVSGGDVVLNMSVLTGDMITDLSSQGVVEAVYKIFQGATAAQSTVNEGAADGDSLAAFSVGSFGNPVAQNDGSIAVTVSSSLTAIIPLDPSTVIGPQI